MINRRLVALILSALLLPLGLEAQRTPPTLPPNAAQTKTLANGLKVVVVEDHAASVVQSSIYYHFGSLQETPGKTGLAHALEHMMFRGTSALSGSGLDDIPARLGAVMNANTDNDYTRYYFVVPADHLELALRIEADRMTNLSLRESDWKLERGAVLGEIDGDFSNPSFKLGDAIRTRAFPSSPFALTALGHRADVAKASVADIKRYYDEFYAPNNATLVITGDVRASDAFELAERWFGPIKAKALPQAALPTPPPDAKKSAVSITGDTPYEIVDLAYRIPGAGDHASTAPQVLASLMSSDRSPFYKSLVLSKVALSYSATTETTLRSGLLHVTLSITPGHTAAEARAAYEATLAQLRTSGVDPALLAAAKGGVATQAIFARDSIAGLGDRYGAAIAIEGIADPAIDDAEVAALKPNDIDAALKTYLNEPSVVGTLLPRATNAKGDPAAAASGVSDNFSKRSPSGPIVQADWVKAALRAPVAIRSKVQPTAFTLANGLRIFVQEVHTNPTVFVSGTIDGSPAFEAQGKEGVGSFAAGLLAYGSAQYDFDAQRKVADDLGASINFGTSFDAHGLAHDLPALLAVLADGERNPTFPEQYLDLFRAQELASIPQRTSDPDYLTSRAFSHLLLPKGDPTLREDSLASIRSITRADMVAYEHRYFRPDLTTIAVVGDVKPEDVRAEIERTFGSWQNEGATPSVKLPPVPPTHPAKQRVPAERDAVAVQLGENAITRSNPDFYAFNVLSNILGGGGSFDTRLMDEVRTKRGLVYGISSTLDVSRDRGLFAIAFNANPKNVRAADALVKTELNRIRTTPVTADEVARARTKIIAGALVSEESTSALVGRVENIAMNQLPLDYYADLGSHYNAITPADILRVAKTYIHPERMIEVYTGPKF